MVFALGPEGFEAGGEFGVGGVQGLDAVLGRFGRVEVLVYYVDLGLAEAQEVDYVAEDFNEARVGGFGEVCEGEVCYTTLGAGRVRVSLGYIAPCLAIEKEMEGILPRRAASLS